MTFAEICSDAFVDAPKPQSPEASQVNPLPAPVSSFVLEPSPTGYKLVMLASEAASGLPQCLWSLGPSQERPGKNSALHKAVENFSLFSAVFAKLTKSRDNLVQKAVIWNLSISGFVSLFDENLVQMGHA